MLKTIDAGYIDKVIDWLSQKDVDVNKAIVNEETLLHAACRLGRLKLVTMLLNVNGILVNTASASNGETALHVASANGNLAIVKELLIMDELEINKPMHNGATSFYVEILFFRRLQFVGHHCSHRYPTNIPQCLRSHRTKQHQLIQQRFQ